MLVKIVTPENLFTTFWLEDLWTPAVMLLCAGIASTENWLNGMNLRSAF